MSIPVFVFYELLIRLSELVPVVGDYQSHVFKGEEVVLRTTTWELHLPVPVLRKQFEDPRLIDDEELAALAGRFMERL